MEFGKMDEAKLRRLDRMLDAVVAGTPRHAGETDDDHERRAIAQFTTLIQHAPTVDDAVKAAKAFGLVGRFLRNGLIWIVATIIAITAFTGQLKSFLGWLIKWTQS